MSRCFPFPPPGYEKKSWTESIDLLTKEKHKEKKHKKEKKDKEKREHKEKKDKDRSKDKHKEKKDRKEKHKDRKRDKEKGRILEDGRTEDRIDVRNELLMQKSLPKAEEAKDSKLMEELGRRTRDDGASNRMVGSFTNSSIQRKVEGMGAVAVTSQKERFADGSQKRNGVNDLPIENVSSSLSRSWISSTAAFMEKERGKTHGNTAQTGSRGISRPMESVFGLVHRKTASSTAELDKRNFGQRETLSSPFTPGIDKGKIGSTFASPCLPTQKKDEILGLSTENVSSIRTKTGGTSGLPPMEKGRLQGCEIFPLPCSSEQRKNSAIGQPLEKDGYQKVERKVKTEDKLSNDSKAPKVRDHIEKKTKAKDNNDGHHKDKKKEEKIVKKVEDVEEEYNKFSNLGPKPLAPHKDNKPGIFAPDGTTKKRKDLETNGFLHENDARPDKSPRLTSSPQPLLNGRKLELHLAAQSKPDTTLDNNGNIKPPPTSGTLVENGEVSSKAPHPDAKHLTKVYTVPKMEAWPEFDEQDWLFKRAASRQKPEAPPEDEDVPQVWARAMRIDSVDVFALPYVVPF
ncbi:hypothetical protein HPP92_025250 [Vanilla planifolia]|uniref:Uncharacterized protein n=1 Tax=Vanilla planifolia TaxID=51239 RepID=A0A835PF13_VANPL|nr:hypothetical protein HPP92_025250 [Vanilla planifolia]